MNDDKVLRFPGAAGPKKAQPAHVGDAVSPPGDRSLGIPGLSADQEKAVQLALSGRSFVLVALEPTPDGADFFTALHGDGSALREALPHLDGVIARLFERRGLTGS